MNVRLISPKNDPHAIALFQRYMVDGGCPISAEGGILCRLSDVIENETELVFTFEMSR